MPDKAKNKLKINKNITYIILLVIILLQLGRIIYSFVYLKEDFHSDEIWSFGLSNSYYQPFIYQSADHMDLINKNTWFSSQVMKDYLTVSRNQRFAYDSVYFNQVHDYHPPFYYFILHTICSFFPEKFSVWYGFVINIFTFIVSMLFMYKLAMRVLKSDILSITACAFYGFSVGAVNTYVFVRMYCLLTLISIVLVYIHTFLLNDKISKKTFFLLFIISLLGCLTHHFFIPYAGLISMCFCCYFLIKKKWKTFLMYSITMLSSVGVSVLLFPETIDHVLSGRINDTKFPFSWQIRMAINCVLSEIFGKRISVVPKISYTALLIEIVCVTVIISPLFFLFRNENWFKNLLMFLKRIISNLIKRIRNSNPVSIAMIISSGGLILLTALTVSMMMMSATADRYIFNVFPLICIVSVLIVSGLISCVTSRKFVSESITIAVTALFCVLSNICGSYNYFFTKPEDAVSIEQYIAGEDCVFISDEYWLLTCFTRIGMKADNIYATTSDDLKKRIDIIPDSLSQENEMYIFVNNGVFFQEYEDGATGGKLPEIGRSIDQSGKLKQDEFEKILLGKYSMCEYEGYDTVFERRFSVYRVK